MAFTKYGVRVQPLRRARAHRAAGTGTIPDHELWPDEASDVDPDYDPDLSTDDDDDAVSVEEESGLEEESEGEDF